MFGAAIRRSAVSVSRNATRSLLRTSVIRSVPSVSASTRVPVCAPALARSFTSSLSARQYAQASAAEPSYSEAEESAQVTPGADDAEPRTFNDLLERKLVHPNLLRAIMQDMKINEMTDVQQQSTCASLAGRDVIAQARTGTGKTLAFLLPIMQHIIKQEPALAYPNRKRVSPSDIRGIIISPTRELAEQIAVEAQKLARHTGIKVQIGVGGTQKSMMLRKTQYEGCHLLVGTPGRLNDLLSDEGTGISAPHLNTFVLDEADRLLDAGFLPEIEGIKRLIPGMNEGDKQTMMLSATISHEVVNLVRTTLKPGFKFVQCVDPNEAPTHERVPQKVVVANDLENMSAALLELVDREIEASNNDPSKRPFKALVFYNSASEVVLADRFFYQLQRKGLISRSTGFAQIHSKLSQAQRTHASDAFRRAKSGVLLSTDVTARGLDFPDVTHVIQMGFPSHGGRDSYIHRLGRTARAGKEGEGWLIIPRLEQNKGQEKLRDLPLETSKSLITASIDMSQTNNIPQEAAEIFQRLRSGFQDISPQDFAAAYKGYVGVYQSYHGQVVVDSINRLATVGWGLEKPPGLPRMLVQKLGWSNLRGLEIETSSMNRFGDRGGFGEDRGGFGGGRGGGGFGGGFGGDRGGDRGSYRGGRGGDRGGFGGGRGGSGGGFGSRGGGEGYGRGRDGGYGRGRDEGYGRGRDGGGGGGRDRGGFGERNWS